MVAPEASFAVIVTGIVAAVPAGGVACASVIATVETTPFSVISTGVGEAPTGAETVPVPSCAPLAFVPA